MKVWTPEQAKSAAHASNLPVFPIRIEWKDGKWNKRPVTSDGHKSATYASVERLWAKLDWSNANGFGIATGFVSGLYAMDIDDYKDGCDAEKWLKANGVHFPTRTHSTISGGRHMIFALRKDHLELPNRQNITKGLDGRGKGGFIAFGSGYEIIDDRFPGILPTEAADAIQAGHSGTLGMDENAVFVAPDDAQELLARFERIMLKSLTLRRRWAGDRENMGKDGKGDASASGMDMSVARILAMADFSYSQVLYMLTVFRFGKYNDSSTPLSPNARWRQAARAANKAVTSHQEDQAMMARAMMDQMEVSDDDMDAALEQSAGTIDPNQA